jgi:hypothetical protein
MSTSPCVSRPRLVQTVTGQPRVVSFTPARGPVKGAGEQNDRREKLAKIYGRSGNEVPSRDSVYFFFFNVEWEIS